MEAISGAEFLPRDKKLPFVSSAIRKLNTVQLLLMVLWETKSLRDKRYIALSAQVDDVGKMLGGWQGQILRQAQDQQNSPARAEEK
ncbi:MAG: four helix bundle protein [Patescibacteria group bacterium]